MAAIAGRLTITVIGGLTFVVFGDAVAEGFTGLIETLSPVLILVAVVLTPLVESLVVRGLVWLFALKLRMSGTAASLATGAVFVPLHGLSAASLSILPFFSLMALIQLNWMRRQKGRAGFWIITGVHALNNLSAVIFVWIAGAG